MTQQGPAQVVPARAAATVLLVRDGEAGLEILLVQRHPKLRFMGGMYVFPGGAVSAGDRSPALHARVRPGEQARAWPVAADDNAALVVALTAIRETFEEVGVWLGQTPEPERAAGVRARLLAGEDFAALVTEAQLWLEPSRLVPLSRWVTPVAEPIRFDTHFYVARAPADQSASHDSSEIVGHRWLTPAAALAQAHAAEIVLSPPTYLTVVELSELGSSEALLAHCQNRPAPLIEPILRHEGGVRTVIYPGDPEHPVKERALKGPTRVSF